MASEIPIRREDPVEDKADALQPRSNLSSGIADLSLEDLAPEGSILEGSTIDGSILGGSTRGGECLTDEPSAQATTLAKAMLRQCKDLVEELEQFRTYLEKHKNESKVELRSFKNNVQAEMKLLNKLSKADPNSSKTSHGLRSSNFSFYTTIWSIAKTCTGLRALSKRFYWTPRQTGQTEASSSSAKQRGMRNVWVDIVSKDGLEWIKVSSATEKRIIWDLAKAGWVDSSDDDTDSNKELSSSGDDDSEGLVKQAETLMKASRATRVNYRHPTVRLILPRIKAEPDSIQVAKVLQKIRKLGIIVETMEEVILPISAPIAHLLGRLAPDQFDSFSDVLNVDCTLLLAFASDLSHGRVEPEDWHNQFISKQIEMESEEQLLPSSLWPACGARKLYCTREAAVRMQEIVDIIGTETEKRRASLMLYNSVESPVAKEEIIHEFQKLSDYTVPAEWQIPIEVVDVDIAETMKQLPPIAEKVSTNLTDINQSVFLYGWAKSLTTISSNRVVAKEIESIIENNREDEETRGPHVWLTRASRSLVGKEKQSALRSQKNREINCHAD